MRRAIRLLFLAAPTVLSGCVFLFYPHTEQVVPAVVGTVTRDGKPVAGARIFALPVLRPDGCKVSRYSAVTDDNGHFAIRGDRDLSLFLVMGDRLNSWGICIAESDHLVEGWRGHGTGVPPRSFDVVCDLGVVAGSDAEQPALCHPGGT